MQSKPLCLSGGGVPDIIYIQLTFQSRHASNLCLIRDKDMIAYELLLAPLFIARGILPFTPSLLTILNRVYYSFAGGDQNLTSKFNILLLILVTGFD